MNSVVAVDPGSRHTGVASAVLVDGQPEVTSLAGVVMHQGDAERSVRERVLPLLRSSPAAVLWLEEPPDYRHSDVEHGSEARIGYALGWVSGLIAGGAGLSTRRVAVSDWRTSMVTTCGRRGIFVEPPRRARAPSTPAAIAQRFDIAGRPAGGFIRTWRGCGHTQQFISFAELSRAGAGACGICSGPEAKQPDPAEWVRDEWKRIACHSVQRLWSGLYAELVAEARGRQRGPGSPPDHRLPGVPDACEAAWIAVHGVLQAGAP